MTDRNEKLNELLSQFFDADQAQQAQTDIRLGDKILFDSSSPVPERQVVENIKRQVAAELSSVRRQKVLRAITAVAAVILILAFAGIQLFDVGSPGPVPVADASIWNESAEIDELMDEVQEIADIMQAIRLGQTDSYDQESFEQWQVDEMETLASSTDFWKGF